MPPVDPDIFARLRFLEREVSSMREKQNTYEQREATGESLFPFAYGQATEPIGPGNPGSVRLYIESGTAGTLTLTTSTVTAYAPPYMDSGESWNTGDDLLLVRFRDCAYIIGGACPT